MHTFVDILLLTIGKKSPSMGFGVTRWGYLRPNFPSRFENIPPKKKPPDLWFLRPRHTVLGRRSPRRYLVRPGWKLARMPSRLGSQQTSGDFTHFLKALVGNFLGLTKHWCLKISSTTQDAILTCDVMSLEFRKRNGPWSPQKGYLKVMTTFFETTNDGRDPAPTEMYVNPSW